MAHNFRLTGAVYVSKAGNDSNAGTSPDAPKATIGGAITANVAGLIVVGTGSYNEVFTIPSGSNITGIVADGTVLFYGTGSIVFGKAVTVTGFIFDGYTSVAGTASSVTYTSCVFKNITAFPSRSGGVEVGNFSQCIFLRCTWAFLTTPITNYALFNSLFIDCYVRNVSKMTGCYVNEFTDLKVYDAISSSNFNNNNIEGRISMGTNVYQNLAAHKVSYPSLNVTSFNLPPHFNNAAKLDFTLQFDSPHIIPDAAFNIGGTQYAKSITVLDAACLPVNGAVLENLQYDGVDLVVSPGFTSGVITTAPILVSPTPVELKFFKINGLLAFNKSTAGGSATNINVPDATVFAGSDASGMGNPDRLVQEFRWTASDVAPAINVDADYPNGGLLAAGVFGKFLTGDIAPSVDNTGKTNGVQGFNQAAVTVVTVTYVQLRLTITNGYL